MTTADGDLPPPALLEPTESLPDPLAQPDGGTIADPTEWFDRRRPEIRRLLEHYVYGRSPEPPRLEVDASRPVPVLDGEAELTELTIGFPTLADDAPAIDLALVTPDTAGPVPVFLALNRVGNHGTIDDPAVSITDAAREFADADRGDRTDFWCVEQLIERGYGFATFHQADVDPDRDLPGEGITHYAPDPPGPAATRWGALAAWAWGLSRAVDVLSEEDAVNSDGIAVIGHSRRGKAALLAGAFDERIALVVPHQSGTGGCALSRDNGQETVTQVNRNFPHWFNDVFPAFAGRVDRLPVDQHSLISLVAPRPLLDTEGSRDYWANPGRALDAVQAAAPVYRLLGADVDDDLLHYGDDAFRSGSVGPLAQYRRETEHTLNSGYWTAILNFVDAHLG